MSFQLLFGIIVVFSLIKIVSIFYLTKKSQPTLQSTNEDKKDIYEIHITVDPTNYNYVKLLSFIDQYTEYKLKPVFAVSSVSNNQYMLSAFIRNTEDEAINKANYISLLLENDKIKVLRIKVESHSISKFPLTIFDLKTNSYFEFHVKVIVGNNTYERLDEDVAKYLGVGVSYNLCSKNLKPLLTIRVYNKGFKYACDHKDIILEELKDKGYQFDLKIQQEYSIYDTNVMLDKGWLRE